MIIVKTKQELQLLRSNLNTSLGFVPTMGALHDGHLSLIAASKEQTGFTVASIFVNPTQFNDPKDYDNYPIDTNADLEKLERAGCDLVFLPSRNEIYLGVEDDPMYLHDFGQLEQVLEGAYRPGHFRGVGQVVHLLFEAVKPNVAFFGEKDFQQLQVIKKLVSLLHLPIEIKGLPTIREEDGLAMSSRNRRLSFDERKASAMLYEALTFAKDNLKAQSPAAIKNEVQARFERSAIMKLEYFDIIDAEKFIPITSAVDTSLPHAVIAAYAGNVRLIDNLALY
jgi:pantoate--beta-alanine ligase